MMNDCDHSSLVWIDLEMSGLDLHVHTIVEIAVAITDFQLKNYVEGEGTAQVARLCTSTFALPLSGPDIVIHHDQDTLDKMNDWSRTQHTKSGLVDLIKKSQVSLFEAETAVINFLQQYCPMGTGILAGNSVFVDRWWVYYCLHAIRVSSFRLEVYRKIHGTSQCHSSSKYCRLYVFQVH